MENDGEKYPGLVCLAFLESTKPQCSTAPNAFPFTASCSTSGFVQGSYSTGTAVVFGSVCGTAQLS